jgi:hypothetical protein
LDKRSFHDGQCVLIVLIVQIPKSGGKVAMPQITHDGARRNPFLAQDGGESLTEFVGDYVLADRVSGARQPCLVDAVTAIQASPKP